MWCLVVDVIAGFALALEEGAKNDRVLSIWVTLVVLTCSNTILVTQVLNFFWISDLDEILFSSVTAEEHLDIRMFATNVAFFLRKVHCPRGIDVLHIEVSDGS